MRNVSNPLLHSPSAHCLQLHCFGPRLAALTAMVSCSRQLLSEKSSNKLTLCSGQQQTDAVSSWLLNAAEHFVDKLLVVTKRRDKRDGTRNTFCSITAGFVNHLHQTHLIGVKGDRVIVFPLHLSGQKTFCSK